MGYHRTLTVGGQKVHIEFGRPPATRRNQEHIGNVHLHIEGICHIRGVSIYKKQKEGHDEIILRMPGYKRTTDAKYETPYLMLDQQIVDAIVEAVESVKQEAYVAYYTGLPQPETIWATRKVKKEESLPAPKGADVPHVLSIDE